jgi:2-polyprenyl-3-methyl-5-hydroxy-6-metoxy-1,4-benzoquinol methylase
LSAPVNNLKDQVRAFWQSHPCGSKFANGEIGSKQFFDLIQAHRYASEWHIPQAADFAAANGKSVLEIGCGVGTDGLQFAKAGARYTGVDLTAAAVHLTQQNF